MANDILNNQELKLKLSHIIGVDWRTLGCWLNIEDNYLEMIDQDNSKSEYLIKAYTMLTKWMQMIDNPTVEELKTTLQNMKRMDLVKKVDDLKSANSPEITSRLSVKKDVSVILRSLKNFYLQKYGYIKEIHPKYNKPYNVNILNNYVDLCIVDRDKIRKDVYYVDIYQLLENYTSIPFDDVFLKEKSLILISGLAGIGKTWLLRKVLLDWSRDLIWQNVDLVFYLECRMLNQCDKISSINELLNVFYKDILKGIDISNYNIMFVIDGLDEFKYFDELISYYKFANPYATPIVKTLAEIRNFKAVIAGRTYAINQYESLSTEYNDKQNIQIMGFSENGINWYIENCAIEKSNPDIQSVVSESPITKSMASVPFFLSCICKIVAESKQSDNLVLTKTVLFARIFLLFLKQHIFKDNDAIYEMLNQEDTKKYILKVSKLAYHYFIEKKMNKKLYFSEEDIKKYITEIEVPNNDDKDNEVNLSVDKLLLGFIDPIKTHEGYLYQFAHLSIMEFCASLHVYINFSGEDIILYNNILENCLPIVFGFTNKQCGLLRLLSLLKNPYTKELSLIRFRDIPHDDDEFSEDEDYYYNKLFIECFYESQSSFTDEIELLVDEQQWNGWEVSIDNQTTSYETSCFNYFVNYLINSGRKLLSLNLNKTSFNDEEKNLVIKCSANVSNVNFGSPIEFEDWKPKDPIKSLTINFYNLEYSMTKKDFEEYFVPWINLCEELSLVIHNKIDFIEDIYEWICCSNITNLCIVYRENNFQNLDDLKTFITCKNV